MARIVSNPRILGGWPVVEGTRVPAQNVMAEVNAGTSRFEIFRSYPSLPLDGIEACIEWDKAGRPVVEIEEPMRAVLFLDLDGTIHGVFPREDRTDEDNQLFAFRPRLESVLRDHPGWQIVISSSWREIRSLESIASNFAADIQPRIIGTTPVIKTKEPPYPAHVRYAEIQQYLTENNLRGVRWIALDDDATLFPPGCANLVLCDDGFREKEEVALRKLLAGMP